MSEHKYWRITYLPSMKCPGECEWVYKGTEEDLAKYLKENHSCNCEDCSTKDSWFDTPNSAEYIIEELEDWE